MLTLRCFAEEENLNKTTEELFEFTRQIINERYEKFSPKALVNLAWVY